MKTYYNIAVDDQTPDPRVSVVIPVYCATEEHEAFLREALASVAAQTFRDFEVVIVDDVSPRDIGPLVESVEGLPLTRVIRNETNLRHARSRNAGIETSRGELVAFLDHDDLWEPEKLASQVTRIDQSPEAGMVFCGVEVFGPYAERLKIDQSKLPERPSVFWFCYHGNYVITATAALVRKSALEEIGLFDPRYTTSDDFDAWLKILERHPIIYMSERLAKYRLHSQNVNYGVDRWNDSSLLFAVFIDYWHKAPLVIKLGLMPRLAKKLIGKVYYSIYRHRRFKE